MATVKKTARAPARRGGRMRARRRGGNVHPPARAQPAPQNRTGYSSPFELLVAVALSAQATDVGVNKATRRLFPVANTPATILALGEDGLKPYISTIGLFNAKAKNVIATCAILLQKYGGECRATAKRWKRCPVSAARPPTWSSTPRSASR